jgi:hypothetical protein
LNIPFGQGRGQYPGREVASFINDYLAVFAGGAKPLFLVVVCRTLALVALMRLIELAVSLPFFSV